MIEDAPPVAVVAYPGVSAYEAVGALAALHAAGMPAEIVSGEALVHAREGARLVPHRLGWVLVESAPAAILPGGDVARALADAALTRALRARHGRWVLASGDALRIASAAGLLEGRRVARLPGSAPLPGAEETPARMVADGRVLTSLGGDALVDLVTHYVSQQRGHDAAQRAAGALGRDLRTFALGAPGVGPTGKGPTG